MQYHRGIALSLHSLFNDLFFRYSALFWKLTWSGSKLLIGCAFLATIDPFVSLCHVYCLFSGAVSYKCYHYLEVCIVLLDMTVPVNVVSVVSW